MKHTGQESGVELCKILIISAVKICKQTASASGGLGPPDSLSGAHWGTSVPQTPWAITPNENS